MKVLDKKELGIGSLSSDRLAFTNKCYINPKLIPPHEQTEQVYAFISEFIFQIEPDQKANETQGVLSKFHRELLNKSSVDKITINFVKVNRKEISKFSSLKFEIEIIKKVSDILTFKDTDIEDYIRKLFQQSFYNIGQVFAIELGGNCLKLRYMDHHFIEETLEKNFKSKNKFGIIDGDTQFEKFNLKEGANKFVKIQSSKLAENIIFKETFDLEKLGIGGLDKEFTEIFMKVFNCRRYPPSILRKYGMKHVKGMLLYGPPGTGKTLIARKIAQALNAQTPKIVAGPELFDKFVGEGERKIRELFADAEKDEMLFGEESKLHIIIFDEIDAICKPRGSNVGGNNIQDSYVNQILSKIDGVETLNNILVIGMTNRLDMIDEAVLRPGRLELHIEVGLPNENGRVQIFRIHTTMMRENNLLAPDVDINELARLTKNYTGAEIEKVVKEAISSTLFEGNDLKNLAPLKDLKDFNKPVTMKKFVDSIMAYKTQFGIDTLSLDNALGSGIKCWGQRFDEFQKLCSSYIEQVRNIEDCRLNSLLLIGPHGNGKTSIAAHLAKNSNFPFIKIISVDQYIGYTENGKVNEINKVFNDAYKSPLSVIIIDEIEKLIEYIGIGPRFSNAILQAILILSKKIPPYPKRRIMIIGTTSDMENMKELGVYDSFNFIKQVPLPEKSNEFTEILKDEKLMSDECKKAVSNELALCSNVSVKNVLLSAKSALSLSTFNPSEAETNGEKATISKDLYMSCYNELTMKGKH